MNEKDLLLKHVELIKDEQLNTFVVTALAKVPEKFWTIPASSTGKYHPEQSSGEGGLVRHVLATLYFARELFTCYSCTEREQDVIIAALILHDIGKAMEEPHDIVAATSLRWLHKELKYENGLIARAISCVRWHMGRWATGSTHCQVEEQGHKSFPSSFSQLEQIVHLADYAASRKRVNLTKLGVTE